MSYYGGTITVKGRNLITSLLAGETLEFTRIVVGSGAMPDGVEPIDMEALVTPVAEAVSTIPVVENGEMFLTVEYRNDLNGGLKEGFWLREFGIFAKTADSDEVLLYYATLGDSPQPVNAYQDNRIDIRRYPVTIALEIDANVQVSYNPGSFITAIEAQELIDGMVNETMNSAIDAALANYANGVGSAIIRRITVPSANWEEIGEGAEGFGDYKFTIDVPVEEAKEMHFPVLALDIPSLSVAGEAEMCQTIETLDGVVRLWAKAVPAADLTGTILLRSENLVDLDIATDEEVDDAVDDIFGEGSSGNLPSGYEVATDEEVKEVLNDIFG